MGFEDFIRGLRNRAEDTAAELRIGDPASRPLLDEAEKRLGVKFPKEIEEFYLQCDGLSLSQPAIRVLSLRELEIDSAKCIGFAMVDNTHRICLDATDLNAAGKWSILNQSTGFCISLSIRSFCYNKCFGWIDKRKSIWEVEASA